MFTFLIIRVTFQNFLINFQYNGVYFFMLYDVRSLFA